MNPAPSPRPCFDFVICRRIAAAVAFCLCLASANAAAQPTSVADTGTNTQILKWKDGKSAVFMLAFDDSAPSQLKNVIPELDKRKIVGTFYVVPGGGPYQAAKAKWEEAAKSPYIVIANHTFTHKGVTNVEELDQELAKCNEVLYKIYPERKVPRLLGFGKPGGVPWVVTKEDVQQELDKHHLADRPPLWGSPIHYKTKEALVAAVDTAIAKGDMGHNDMHGVGGDWLTTPLDWFTALLDKLEASRDQLWITDTVSWHQYVKERQNAEIKVPQDSKDGIRVELTSKVDPALYNMPLTLSTKVPTAWKECVVAQGANKVTVPVKDGAVQYDALPNGGAIDIRSK